MYSNNQQFKRIEMLKYSQIIILIIIILSIFFFFDFLLNRQNLSISNQKDDEKETLQNPKNQILKQQKEIEINYTQYFKQPTFSNKKFNTTKFNYENECRNIFKYKPNDKRDLIFSSYTFHKNGWTKTKKMITTTMSITQSGVPNATKILYLYGEPPMENFKEFLKSFGWEMYISPFSSQMSSSSDAAIYRFIDFENYLKENKDKFDRVAITDFRDIMWFADGFQCFSDKEMFINKECDGIPFHCNNYKFPNTKNGEWLRDTYGEEVLEQFAKESKDVLNVGFILSNTTQMLEFLRIYNNVVKTQQSKNLKYWGLDQATLNYVYHSGLLNHLNITLGVASQRFAFDLHGKNTRYERREKVLYDTNSNNCSPVIRHKIHKILY